jgi:hypothetical protein
MQQVRLPIATAIHDAVHAVQFYETDAYLIEALSAYVGRGLASGEAAVVVATPVHRAGLEARLAAEGIDLARAREHGTYVPLDAAELLSRFMVDGALSEPRFFEIVGGVIRRARGENGGSRRVRVFGEMVALLWADGRPDDAIELERLWNELARTLAFALVCGYPVSLFGAGSRKAPGVAEVAEVHEQQRRPDL